MKIRLGIGPRGSGPRALYNSSGSTHERERGRSRAGGIFFVVVTARFVLPRPIAISLTNGRERAAVPFSHFSHFYPLQPFFFLVPFELFEHVKKLETGENEEHIKSL